MTECAVVLRTLNEAKGLREVLPVLKAQEPEPPRIIAVDSGSADETLELLREAGATIVRIAPEQFSYGRALNMGLAEVREPFAAMLSAHAVPRSRYWLADLVAPMKRDAAIAAVSGAINGGIPNVKDRRTDIVLTSVAQFRANPSAALVNVNAAVRMSVWREFAFNEEMPACEDREWMVRVLEAGHKVCLSTGGDVWHGHEDDSPRSLYRRGFREYLAMNPTHVPGYVRLAVDVLGRPFAWFVRGAWRWVGYTAWRLGQVRGRAAARRRGGKRWGIDG